MDAFREEYRNVQILIKMLEEFRRKWEKRRHSLSNIVNSKASWERIFLAYLHSSPKLYFYAKLMNNNHL